MPEDSGQLVFSRIECRGGPEVQISRTLTVDTDLMWHVMAHGRELLVGMEVVSKLPDQTLPFMIWSSSSSSWMVYSPALETMKAGSNLCLLQSFVELVKYLFTLPDVSLFLSNRLCQDPLEKFFGQQRQRGRVNENPNVMEFVRNTQALRVINTTCAKIRVNCRGANGELTDKIENAPIAKRRRKYHHNNNQQYKSTVWMV